MVNEFRLKKMITLAEIASFWAKKRAYEKQDIFPHLKEKREELIQWFESNEYYDAIMTLHENKQGGGNYLQFAFIYTIKEKYIGFIMYKIYDKEDGKCFILDFCIDDKLRNQKIGSHVIFFFEKFVKENEGAIYFALNASSTNSARFWKRLGYIPTEIDENGEMLYTKTP